MPQASQPAGHPRVQGLYRAIHFARGIGLRQAAQVAQGQGVALGGGQGRQVPVEQRGDLLPGSRRCRGLGLLHGCGLPFVARAPPAHPAGVAGDSLGRPVKPAGEHRAPGQPAGLAGQEQESRLDGVLGGVRVGQHAQAGCVDHPGMAPDYFGEGLGRTVPQVGGQYLPVGCRGASLFAHCPAFHHPVYGGTVAAFKNLPRIRAARRSLARKSRLSRVLAGDFPFAVTCTRGLR